MGKRHRRQRPNRGHLTLVKGGAAPMPVAKPGKTAVMVAVPTVDGNVNWSIAPLFGMCAQLSMDPDHPFAYMTHVRPGVRPVAFARNLIVQLFRETCQKMPLEWLVMIDADQVVPGNFFELMCVNNADIVGGLTRTWVSMGEPAAALRFNQYAVDDLARCFNIDPPEPAKAGAAYMLPVVGTGCIAIRRRVIDALGEFPFYFTTFENGAIKGGEDINFCVDAGRKGFAIAVNPRVQFGHVKEIDLAQIEHYYEARRGMELRGEELRPEQKLSLGMAV